VAISTISSKWEMKAGLVVGDVTGKSVSGALVMSSSRSVFRMLSEEKLTVGDIMVRANRRIKRTSNPACSWPCSMRC
jgi:serine phosphatase RsbU (regulator of sigma subunit)